MNCIYLCKRGSNINIIQYKCISLNTVWIIKHNRHNCISWINPVHVTLPSHHIASAEEWCNPIAFSNLEWMNIQTVRLESDSAQFWRLRDEEKKGRRWGKTKNDNVQVEEWWKDKSFLCLVSPSPCFISLSSLLCTWCNWGQWLLYLEIHWIIIRKKNKRWWRRWIRVAFSLALCLFLFSFLSPSLSPCLCGLSPPL